MSTVAEVTDRTFRDFLVPADDQPMRATLTSAVSKTETSWPLSLSMLAPDEQDVLAPGVIVEAGSEQVLVTDVDGSTATVVRGRNGTEAAAHDSGSLVVLAPLFGRATVVEAVKDQVVSLFPSLWHVDTVEVTTTGDYVEVPAETVTPVRFLVDTGSRYVPVQVDLMTDFPPSQTGKAVVPRGYLPAGYTGFFTFRSRFCRPSFDTDPLGQFGVQPGWERIVSAGAAAQVIPPRDSGQLSVEYVTEALEREASPVEAPRFVRDGLLQLRSIWLDEAARDLRAQDRHPTVYNPVALR